MSKRVYDNPPMDALIMGLAPYILGGVVLFILWKKSQSSLPAKVAEVKQGIKDIKAGLPGYVKEKISGKSEKDYKSQSDANKEAIARASETRRARLSNEALLKSIGVVPIVASKSNLPPFLYGL